MPPRAGDDITEAVAEVLWPFCESNEDEDEHGYRTRSDVLFYDWHEIGGRWSGLKQMATLDVDKVNKFQEMLNERGFTVHGLQMGKPELNPKSQEGEVNALWRRWFPDSGFEQCPLFRHAGKSLDGDIMQLKDCMGVVDIEHVIIAAYFPPNEYRKEGRFEAVNQWRRQLWNGVTHQKTTFDGTIQGALMEHKDKIEGYKEEYKERCTPTGEWWVVTVDYHS